MPAPVVSVVVPTRNRAPYLEIALRSLARQQFDAPYELLVVDDCSADSTPGVVERSAIRCVRFDRPRGLNAARNVGVGATTAPLIAFVDDDVYAPPTWLAAIVEGASQHPEADVFGGPIRARFEGRTPSSCGRESPPITTLDLGDRDIEAEIVWGANLAVRRQAFDRVGPFDEGVAGHGDEEDWLHALRATGGRIVYLAAAGLDHRRAGADARLLPLARAAYWRGRAARVSDQRRASAPRVSHELRILAGCAWHGVHFACPQSVIMGAHSAGRLVEALRPRHRGQIS